MASHLIESPSSELITSTLESPAFLAGMILFALVAFLLQISGLTAGVAPEVPVNRRIDQHDQVPVADQRFLLLLNPDQTEYEYDDQSYYYYDDEDDDDVEQNEIGGKGQPIIINANMLSQAAKVRTTPRPAIRPTKPPRAPTQLRRPPPPRPVLLLNPPSQAAGAGMKPYVPYVQIKKRPHNVQFPAIDVPPGGAEKPRVVVGFLKSSPQPVDKHQILHPYGFPHPGMSHSSTLAAKYATVDTILQRALAAYLSTRSQGPLGLQPQPPRFSSSAGYQTPSLDQAWSRATNRQKRSAQVSEFNFGPSLDGLDTPDPSSLGPNPVASGVSVVPGAPLAGQGSPSLAPDKLAALFQSLVSARPQPSPAAGTGSEQSLAALIQKGSTPGAQLSPREKELLADLLRLISPSPPTYSGTRRSLDRPREGWTALIDPWKDLFTSLLPASGNAVSTKTQASQVGSPKPIHLALAITTSLIVLLGLTGSPGGLFRNLPQKGTTVHIDRRGPGVLQGVKQRGRKRRKRRRRLPKSPRSGTPRRQGKKLQEDDKPVQMKIVNDLDYFYSYYDGAEKGGNRSADANSMEYEYPDGNGIDFISYKDTAATATPTLKPVFNFTFKQLDYDNYDTDEFGNLDFTKSSRTLAAPPNQLSKKQIQLVLPNRPRRKNNNSNMVYPVAMHSAGGYMPAMQYPTMQYPYQNVIVVPTATGSGTTAASTSTVATTTAATTNPLTSLIQAITDLLGSIDLNTILGLLGLGTALNLGLNLLPGLLTTVTNTLNNLGLGGLLGRSLDAASLWPHRHARHHPRHEYLEERLIRKNFSRVLGTLQSHVEAHT